MRLALALGAGHEHAACYVGRREQGETRTRTGVGGEEEARRRGDEESEETRRRGEGGGVKG